MAPKKPAAKKAAKKGGKEVKKTQDKSASKSTSKKGSTSKQATKAKSGKKDAKKDAPKKAAGKKDLPKKAAGKKDVPKKADAKKDAPKKADAKKDATKNADAKKDAPKKAAGKKDAPKSSAGASNTKTVKKSVTKGSLVALPTPPSSVAVPTPPAAAPTPASKPQASASTDVKMVTKVLKGKIPVDDLVPNASTCHVFEDAECTWACMLNQSNVGANNNKFYVIQLLVMGGSYGVWTRWGRVGVPGQTNMAPCPSLDSAKNTFTSKFSSKAGVHWSQRQNATPRPGKYAFIEMDYDVPDEDMGQSNAQVRASKLPSEVQHLVKLICDIDMMKKSLIEVGYDAKKMPLGKISTAMVSSGFTKLQEISAELKGAKRQFELERLTSEFFTVVPHDIGFKKMTEFTIDTNEKLKEKILMVESLKEIEVAHKLLTKKGSKEANPIDTHYENLDCGLKPVERGSPEWNMVDTYATNTHGKTHSCKLTLRNLYTVNKPDGGKFNKFQYTHNRQLLWHGSRLTNWCGILGQGLRIAPPEAPVTGYMFGKGVYFADCISKSANYCNAYSSNNRGLLLLCEVALGDMNEKLQSDYHADKLPLDKLSTKGLGRLAPMASITTADGLIVPNGKIADTNVPNACLCYNEFIVYNTAQIKPKYLCLFDFK